MTAPAHEGILIPVSSKQITVKKRDGSTESFNVDKINRVLEWATEGLKKTCISDVVVRANMRFYEGMTTEAIHKALIEAAVDLISEETPNYQYVASRLTNFDLRKRVWGGTTPPKYIDFLRDVQYVHGVYDDLLSKFTEEELEWLDSQIKHDRDFALTHAGIKQLIDKYLVQDRGTGVIFETPQFAYMSIAATLFASYPNSVRLDYIKKHYDLISNHVINLPTPQLAGIRTDLRSYASCMLVDVDDNKESIFNTASAVGLATTDRYGIGINVGRIRAVNAKIGKGATISTGLVPFIKLYQASTKASQQNGLRGGGATVYFQIWHYEAPELLMLKNNAGTEENRARKLDYGVTITKDFYLAAVNEQDWHLFSPHEVKDLYEAYGDEGWKTLYDQYAANDKLMKRTVKANTLLQELIQQRTETGRIYCLHLDHARAHSAWKIPVHMSNLCIEILHPVVPLDADSGQPSEIGTCILAALNWLKLSTDEEWSNAAEMTLRSLWQVINHQWYFNEAAERFTFRRRSVAVGITNFAAWLAKHGRKWTDEDTPTFVSQNMEKQAYWLTYWAWKLAEEFGVPEAFGDTKYSDGVLPLDTYCKFVDTFVDTSTNYDWETLRENIKRDGMAFSTLMALMPCESSSVVGNCTNGVEPPREPLTAKKSKAGLTYTAVPFYGHPASKNYQYAYSIKDNKAILRVWAALVKWIDMGASVNLYYRYEDFPGGAIPQELLLADQLYSHKVGIPTLYYLNTDDGSSFENQAITDASCESGACAI